MPGKRSGRTGASSPARARTRTPSARETARVSTPTVSPLTPVLNPMAAGAVSQAPGHPILGGSDMRRRWLLVAPFPLVLAACGGGGGSPGTLAAGPTATPAASPTLTAPATHRAAPSASRPGSPSPSASRSVRTTAHAPSPTRSAARPRPSARPSPTHKPTPPAPAPYIITMTDYAFSPANASVRVGTPVKIANHGPSSHTWTSGSTPPVHSGPFDSGNLDRGQTYVYTF